MSTSNEPAQTFGPQSNGVTAALARFVLQSCWEDLPEAVRHEGSRAFLNWVGCAYGGSHHPAVECALRGASKLSSNKMCTILGRKERLDALSASMINGLSASANAFDDAHISTVIHPAAPTVSALLAYAEQHPVSGADFLHALILSHEVQCRLSCALAIAPAKSHLGHYLTGLTGPVGVSAAVGRLMGLSKQQLIWAMGIAAMQAGGVRASHASMSAAFIPGNAGRNGLLAAHLASENFTCHPEPLMSQYGLLQVVGNPPNPAAILDGLGARWECMNVAIKPFPNGCLIHAATDVCLKVSRDARFVAENIERVRIEVHPLAAGLTAARSPKNANEAQVSLYHWAAAALVHGNAGLQQASDECVTDPRVIAIRNRVEAQEVIDLAPDEARAVVELKNGQLIKAEVRPHAGAASLPLTDEQLESKFSSQVAPLLGHESSRDLISRCWGLVDAGNVGKAAPGHWGQHAS
ncbi:MmgE/PrpD family protein [Xylophilus sp. ASV27]|uniref:MmgE/PrpD family protein n=1 Tax=Xylophilus sp. ASV27 TaxID=2795129 RepID=UPI0018EB7A9D|nr:MmgE/PrpD family protein [Xylophilus sp. ASV27]